MSRATRQEIGRLVAEARPGRGLVVEARSSSHLWTDDKLLSDRPRALDRQSVDRRDKDRQELVLARGATVLDLHGIGPSAAPRLLADVGDIRPPSPGPVPSRTCRRRRRLTRRSPDQGPPDCLPAHLSMARRSPSAPGGSPGGQPGLPGPIPTLLPTAAGGPTTQRCHAAETGAS